MTNTSNLSQIHEFIRLSQQQISHDIELFVQTIDMPDNLREAVMYATLNGGKRVRPALVYASYYTSLGMCFDGEKLALSASARKSALSVELLHCYSLVHDDLPCMDDDDLRRGVPTCHIAHGEAVALLAGDILQTLAFEVLHTDIFENTHDEDAQIAQLLAVFAPRARRMVTGQMRDINAEQSASATQAQLEQIHVDKTGALIEASVLMGAINAGACESKLVELESFAKKLGLAFQVQDDILDITASTEDLGKPAGSDEKLDKSTYPKLMGLAQAQAYATQLFDGAKQNLTQDFSDDNLLTHFADWLWARKH